MNNKISKASMIIGIVSVAFALIECYLPIIIFGILLGIAAIIVGVVARKNNKDNLSFVGIVLGVCGIVVALIWLYLYIIA